MKRRYSVILVIIALLPLWNCSLKYTPPDLSGYVWPPPPEKARVKLLKVIQTDLDVRERSSLGKLFGEAASFIFIKPFGIAVDSAGNIYVSDTYLKRILILNLAERSIKQLFNPYGWKMPSAIAVDEEHGILAATNGNTVDIFDLKKRKLLHVIGQKGDFIRPSGLAFDAERKILYIADIKKNEIYAYDYDWKFVSKIAGPGGGDGQVHFPTALATDREGRLYVVDTMNFRVQIFNPGGAFLTVFGVVGDIPGTFQRPKGIAISKDGFLLVTDASVSTFQIFDREGNVYLWVGRPGSGYGNFNIPARIFIDENDKIYVVDSLNRRIQIFQLMTDRYYEELKKEGEAAEEEKPAPEEK